MKEGFRQSMAWLHTWSGLLVCWVLLLIFCAGTTSYYREEVSLWMRPELHAAAAGGVAPAAAAEVALAVLGQRALQAERWSVTLPGERNPATRIGWSNPPKPGAEKQSRRARFKSELLDPASGAVIAAPRETRGGEFFYRLHFDLHYMPVIWARWLVGFCAMFMLVSIVSGVITHKRIFKDLFTFRPGKGQRSWLDAHNVTAVLALPYHLMITYTGLVTLMFLYMPVGVSAAYKDNGDAFFDEAFPRFERNVKASGQRVPLTPLRPLLEQAERRWGTAAGAIAVSFPGDANATVTLTRPQGAALSHQRATLHFDGATGALLGSGGEQPAPAAATQGVMVGLHLAHFAGPLLRALFFVSGLAGCAMVATGALLWAVKSRQKQAKALAAGARRSVGLWLVEALNIGAIAGLPIAYAAYFWANRLLPVALPQRPDQEIACFFAAWGAAAALALLRPTRAMWRWQLGAGALLFAGLPLLNLGGAHLGRTLFQNGASAVAGFDLTALLFALALGYAARRMGRPRAARPTQAAAPAQPPRREAA
ncbi:PepSY-associated TM helix domain-containing protein [Janthinobacterium fluminis]|uniref:PepSY-associated TM helix domain-containing protein n=1 Tax=Janthinobacterium fluminis TaxID=2987524 RepID=A0ABT5K4F3_9BURK|nr:PepSY-associated TM helix domain-containing protein [Janthinobacterium fluminis]MDC8758981.1 PepSY-associated TM helix domain-containing protein [Janthinobacterium fluminis]